MLFTREEVNKILNNFSSAKDTDELIKLDIMRSLREIADSLDAINRLGVEVIQK